MLPYKGKRVKCGPGMRADPARASLLLPQYLLTLIRLPLSHSPSPSPLYTLELTTFISSFYQITHFRPTGTKQVTYAR